MRKLVIFIAGVAVLGTPVYVFGTGFGSLVSSFKSPAAWLMGLAYREPGYLYISVFAGNIVWRTTKTGSVVSYHPTRLGYNRGVTVGKIAGTIYYWVADKDTNRVYRFVDNSSHVAGSFPWPGPEVRGVAFVDTTHMYGTDYQNNYLYYLHPLSGSVYSSYALGMRPNDLSYDAAGYLWIAGTKSVHKFTTTGSAVRHFDTYDGYAIGSAYDGEYVWAAVSDARRGFFYIMQYNVREEPGIEPKSIGRIKAVFR